MYKNLFAVQPVHPTPHVDAGDALAREAAAGLVRVDDDVGGRQRDLVVDERGQMVIGHEHAHPHLTKKESEI